MQGHMVSFIPSSMRIFYWGAREYSELALEGETRMEFAPERHCIGYNDGECIHACPSKFEGKKQCGACAARDISRVYTRLDYAGFESFYAKFRNQEFSVYLASFSHIVKCGVTRSARLMERVTEQGADYFCELAHASDADSAYSIESAIHHHFPVRSGLTSSQKLKLITQNPTPSRLSDCLTTIRESGLLEGFEGKMEISRLAYPVPASFSEAQHIDGTVKGAKGQILFFEKEGQGYAVNMSKKGGSDFSFGTATG